MDNSRTLIIGFPAPGDFHGGKLLSNVNLDEYTCIIWNIASLAQELSKVGKFDGSAMSEEVKKIVERIVSQSVDRLMQWVAAGHWLVAVTDRPATMVWQNILGNRGEYQLDARLLIDGLQLHAISGTRVEYVGLEGAEPYFINCRDLFRYEVVLEGGSISPLLVASRASKGPRQIVAGCKKIGKGIVILVPPAPEVRPPSALYENFAGLGQALLAEGRAELPDWAVNYQIDFERAAREKIAQYRIDIAGLEKMINEQELVVAEASCLKGLFAGTGETFVSAVRSALIRLGLIVVDGPHPRADLLAFDGKRILAIEVKGLEKASKEGNLRQVAMWLAEVQAAVCGDPELVDDPVIDAYIARLRELGVPLDAETSVTCHGLMVIGTFRQTPLSERKGPDFPEPVPTAISRTDVCAMTGLQLMGLVLRSRDQPAERARIVELLFSTRGVLNEQSDWTTFLTAV